jgi:hypothetical protein
MRPFLLLLLAAFLALPACAQAPTKKAKVKVKTTKKAVVKPVKKEEVPALTFERTACFGKCPRYKARIFADGRVAYEGIADVPQIGLKEFKLPASVVAEMQQMARDMRFDKFQDRYSRNTTDIPSTIVGVKQANGQVKTVVVEEGAPEELSGLINYLRSKLDPLAGLVTNADR